MLIRKDFKKVFFIPNNTWNRKELNVTIFQFKLKVHYKEFVY